MIYKMFACNFFIVFPLLSLSSWFCPVLPFPISIQDLLVLGNGVERFQIIPDYFE